MASITPTESAPPSPTGSVASLGSGTTGSGRKRDRQADDVGDGKALKRITRANTTLTLETVMDKLVAISTAQTRQGTLLQDLPIIRDTIHTVSTDIAALKTTTEALSATSSLLVGKTDALAQENEQLRASVAALATRVDQLSAAGNASAMLNLRPSTSTQLHEITISGLLLGSPAENTLIQLATVVAKTLNVAVLPGDFLSARILRKATPETTPPPSVHTLPIKSTFAVVCRDHGVMARLLASKRSHGVMRYSQLDSSCLTNLDPAAVQSGDPIINVSELLPSNVLKLLTDAKALLKPLGFKFIWTRNAKVCVKFANDSPIQLVNSSADLPGIAQLYALQPPGPQRS